jgi:cytochrome c oxidase subunit 2
VDFPGSPFQQHVGPPLTHVGGRTTIAAGILTNNPANMKRWIHDAPSVKPGSLMPSMAYLTDQQVDAIVAYLQSLK